ncbi:CDP-diacylglycerol--glycerol-3-phosphate 3-phosphatidyltransferase [Apophysomyces sp. BC1034]|nr:CDP-diacylglycerol--glycerol-3-phosphate 3-phosphatidyltransferase [Apophysomyces sp. BC1021]KAG0187866.1 CDP-diacylglycerol--glycerol-3-phosphate 3-phosphatidyltransferase [Apophysomyces sp. BC1034]
MRTLSIRFIRHASRVVPQLNRTFSSKPEIQKLASSLSPLNSFTSLQHLAPTFYTRGDHVIPLYEPSHFYTELKVDTIRLALSRSDKLKVHVLIDCLRGTRVSKNQSSATLLLPLLQEFPGQIRVSMYHTPDLKGVLKRTLPQRFNETIGLMHLKVYGFDDTVMLSGANLSVDYFSNRQDRYMVFKDQPGLAQYYHDLLDVVGSFSYGLTSGHSEGYQLVMSDNTADPVRESRKFKAQVSERLQHFVAKSTQKQPKNEEHDTAVLPVIQMGPFGIKQDERATLELLQIANRHGARNTNHKDWWTVHLTSGYFNFTDRYTAFILKTQARFRFLTASPEANGFFNSKGISGYLPSAYTYIERQFFRQVKREKKQNTITIEEYARPGWTYHAKGLWVCRAEEKLPCLTMVGSPNFGHRSSKRDLEAQAIVITENRGLQKALYKEVDRLHQYSQPVSDKTFEKLDRRVPYGVRVATTIIKTML